MKMWFWVFLCILMLMVGCASGYSAGKRPANQEEISDYWSSILYHQTPQEYERR